MFVNVNEAHPLVYAAKITKRMAIGQKLAWQNHLWAVSQCIQRPWAMYYLTGARDLFGVRHYTQHRHPLGQSPRRLPNVQGDVPRLSWWRTDTIQRAALLRTKRAHPRRKPRTTLSCPCSYLCPSGAA